jgi:hypothetical protein
LASNEGSGSTQAQQNSVATVLISPYEVFALMFKILQTVFQFLDACSAIAWRNVFDRCSRVWWSLFRMLPRGCVKFLGFAFKLPTRWRQHQRKNSTIRDLFRGKFFRFIRKVWSSYMEEAYRFFIKMGISRSNIVVLLDKNILNATTHQRKVHACMEKQYALFR